MKTVFATMQVHNDTLAAYFLDGYAAVRVGCQQCFVTITPPSNAQNGNAWRNFMAGSGYTNVFQDLHRCRRLLCISPVPTCYGAAAPCKGMLRLLTPVRAYGRQMAAGSRHRIRSPR